MDANIGISVVVAMFVCLFDNNANKFISIGSQPFAQVLLCFSSGTLLLKNIGNKLRMILTVEWEILFPMGE